MIATLNNESNQFIFVPPFSCFICGIAVIILTADYFFSLFFLDSSKVSSMIFPDFSSFMFPLGKVRAKMVQIRATLGNIHAIMGKTCAKMVPPHAKTGNHRAKIVPVRAKTENICAKMVPVRATMGNLCAIMGNTRAKTGIVCAKMVPSHAKMGKVRAKSKIAGPREKNNQPGMKANEMKTLYKSSIGSIINK